MKASHRILAGVAVPVVMLAGCPGGDPVPYVTLGGYVTPPRNAAVSLSSARLDLVSVKGDLGKEGVARLVTTSTEGVYRYSVQLDATVLPRSPTLFKLVVQNPEQAPRNVPLLSTLVALHRPDGKGPELGEFRANIDATSSIAALGIEYRVNLDPDGEFAGVNPEKAALHLGRNNLIVFNFLQAYSAFVSGGRNDGPAASLEIAQQASEDLPQNLEAL